jgi:hypothetical protein
MGGTICVFNRPTGQATKAIISMPWFITNKLIECIRSAEEKLGGKPPNCMEIFVEMKIRFTELPINNVFEGAAVLASLMREDWIYTNSTGSHVSLTRHPGFFTFSEQVRKHFGINYEFVQNGSLVTSKHGRTLNLDEVVGMLKSKDNSLLEKNKWIFDNEFRFLDGKPLKTKIAFCTFPRSGNSLMRRLLETATGIVTGSAGSLHTGTYL